MRNEHVLVKEMPVKVHDFEQGASAISRFYQGLGLSETEHLNLEKIVISLRDWDDIESCLIRSCHSEDEKDTVRMFWNVVGPAKSRRVNIGMVHLEEGWCQSF